MGLSRATVDVAGQIRDRLRLIGFCSGVQIKTRKRNIAVALDPGSFAEAVVTIFEDQKDGDDLEKNLLAGVKVQQLFSIMLAVTHAILLICSRCWSPAPLCQSICLYLSAAEGLVSACASVK